jgi:hypothetical protein
LIQIRLLAYLLNLWFEYENSGGSNSQPAVGMTLVQVLITVLGSPVSRDIWIFRRSCNQARLAHVILCHATIPPVTNNMIPPK